MAEVIELPDEDDASFLELVAAAEAKACVAKRQKVSDSMFGVLHQPSNEGSYMAALKGSWSSLWQQQQKEIRSNQRKSTRGGGNNTMGSDASTISSVGGPCFKCGVSGHWTRDCTPAAGKENAGGFTNVRAPSLGDDRGEVPEKACPCGSGICLILTSNTPKNPGRKFYRCPVKEENGGCDFFEWCDSSSKNLPATHSSNYGSNSSVPDLSCPCGAGSCLVLVTKNGKNVGRQFYRCPAKEGYGYCGFFKWCDNLDSASGRPASAANNIENINYPGSQVYGETRGSSCFKCGQEGHWSRDCPMLPSEGYASTRGWLGVLIYLDRVPIGEYFVFVTSFTMKNILSRKFYLLMENFVLLKVYFHNWYMMSCRTRKLLIDLIIGNYGFLIQWVLRDHAA